MLTPIVLVTRLSGDVPATPDAEEAREAAERELTRGIYQDRPSIWEMLWSWIREHLSPGQIVPGVPPWLSALIVVITAAALVGALLLLLTHVTLAQRRHVGDASLFEGDERDSMTLTRDADAAAGRHDWATAVVDRFRAIIRSLDERALVEDYPGMTAQEAGALACQALLDVEGLHVSLQQAAGLFDAIRYGRVVPNEQKDEWMRRLAERVACAAPRPSQQGTHRVRAKADDGYSDVYSSTSPVGAPGRRTDGSGRAVGRSGTEAHR